MFIKLKQPEDGCRSDVANNSKMAKLNELKFCKKKLNSYFVLI